MPLLPRKEPDHDELVWRRQNTWASWIAACTATPGMRENENERMLGVIALKDAK